MIQRTKQHQAAARLQRWFTGEYDRPTDAPPVPDGHSAEVLVLPDADLGALGELSLCPESLVLAPEGWAPARDQACGAKLLTYEGGLTGDEDELLLGGGIVVRRESYTTAAFVPVTCPTAVAILGPEDHENFLADADAAVQHGTFEEHLLHPLVLLTDTCALGSDTPCAAPRRARAVIGPDGVRPALGGAPFATGDLHASRCTICLGGVVAPDDLEAGRRARPWLSRYLRVLDVLRGLRRREPGTIEVSGFGYRFNDTLPPEPLEATPAPVLLRAGDDHLVCDPLSRRVLRTAPDAARILEVVLAGRGGDLADEVARHLDLPAQTAAIALDQVRATVDGLGFPLALEETA
jgi:hypothetical protein